MVSDTKQKILKELASYPQALRSSPATEPDLVAFEAEFGPVPQDFRWFLQNCGGGVVGREHLDGLDQLPTSQRKYQSELDSGGWSMRDVFIIGWDGGGNPIGLHRRTGEVLVEDHTFGGVHTEAPSFGEYILDLLSPSRR